MFKIDATPIAATDNRATILRPETYNYVVPTAQDGQFMGQDRKQWAETVCDVRAGPDATNN